MRSLLYIVFIFVITGCSYGGSKTSRLDEARRLMQSDPAAALSTLNDIDISQFQDSAVMAEWALLYSEAMVINRVSAPTDTIVNIAVDYYGKHNQPDLYRKASRLKALIKATDNRDDLATALYLRKEKEFMLYQERAKLERYILTGLIIILISAMIIVRMKQRLKLQTLKNDALMAEATGLKYQIDTGRDAIGRMEKKLRGLLETRFELIDSLCQTYYESQGTKIERKAVVEKVKNEIESLRTDYFPKMEQAVNDCRHNILVMVKDNLTDIKPDDYQLLVFIASGLSTRTICLLLDESVNVIYKRKSRLKARLKETVAPVCPEILDLF